VQALTRRKVQWTPALRNTKAAARRDKLAGWMAERFGERPLRLEIVRRRDTQKGFAVLPRRWVLERTFGWLNNFRRLSKDYEFRTDSSEAFIFLAASLLLIARLP
jgi:putative transposase